MVSAENKEKWFPFIYFLSFTAVVPTIEALDCFACHSVNGSDRRCEDPMIRIYEGFLKPETCALPTKIVNKNPNQDDEPLMVNTKAIFLQSQYSKAVNITKLCCYWLKHLQND